MTLRGGGLVHIKKRSKKRRRIDVDVDRRDNIYMMMCLSAQFLGGRLVSFFFEEGILGPRY